MLIFLLLAAYVTVYVCVQAHFHGYCSQSSTFVRQQQQSNILDGSETGGESVSNKSNYGTHANVTQTCNKTTLTHMKTHFAFLLITKQSKASNSLLAVGLLWGGLAKKQSAQHGR